MKIRGLAAVVTTLSLATPFAAASGQPVRLQTNKALMTQTFERVGCTPPPELRNEPHNHILFAWYCLDNKILTQSMGEGHIDISTLVQRNPHDAILALRAVPESQKAERDIVAQAAAIEIAQAAVDYAFAPAAGKDDFLNNIRVQLNSGLAGLSRANETERAAIHKKSYDLRLELERKNYKYHYVQAAHAVAMASSIGEPGILGEPPGVSRNERAWVSLNRATEALDSTYLYSVRGGWNEWKSARVCTEEIYHPEYPNLSYSPCNSVKAQEITKNILLRHLAPHQP